MAYPSDLADLAVRNPVLRSCTAETRALLHQRGSIRTFRPGAVLLGDGEPAALVLFPLEGALQMVKADCCGRRQVICNPEALVCGGICLLALGDRVPVQIVGLEAGRVLMVRRADFEEAVMRDPTLNRAAWRSAANCMEHFSALVTQLSFYTVAERVVMALLDGSAVDGDVVRLTQAELAATVGTTREVVARSLGELRDLGAVRLGRGRIIVADREKLRARL